MTHTVDIEILTRPTTGTAVSLVAERLRIRLPDDRSGLSHDYRLRRDERLHPVVTVVPRDAAAWLEETRRVWNEVEWTERHGPVPVAIEVQVNVPDGMAEDGVRALAMTLAMFVAMDLHVPVTFVVFDGEGGFSVADELRRHIRLVFPTRAAAKADASDAILDRSGQKSSFAGRLPLTTNRHLAQNFARRVAREADSWVDRSSAPTPSVRLNPISKRDPFIFPLDEDDEDVLLPSLETDPTLHPLVARLRREAPRGMTMPDLRDFEFAMSLATNVEDALKEVSEVETRHDTLGEQQTRASAHALDHEYELDRARERQAAAGDALRAINERAGSLFDTLRRRMDVMSGVRDRKAAEAVRANEHVGALEAAVSSLRSNAETLRQEKVVASHSLTRLRDELKDHVRRLHGTDPRVLVHLLGIITEPERTYLKSAMARAVPVIEEGSDPSRDEGKSGPPVKPSRTGMGPKH
jgi:hypothetical protein